MTRKIHTERPKRKCGAQIAWDYFLRSDGAVPIEMWFTHLSYPCWVAKFADGEIEDIDNLSLATNRAKLRESKMKYYQIRGGCTNKIIGYCTSKGKTDVMKEEPLASFEEITKIEFDDATR